MKSFYLRIWNFLEVGGRSEKIMETPGCRGRSGEALWNRKSWWVGAQIEKNPPWGVWIFSGTTQCHLSLGIIPLLVFNFLKGLYLEI